MGMTSENSILMNDLETASDILNTHNPKEHQRLSMGNCSCN